MVGQFFPRAYDISGHIFSHKYRKSSAKPDLAKECYLSLKEILDIEYAKRNCDGELCEISRPDPLIVARDHKDEYVSLVCALFAYGKASLIVKFLRTIPFEILDESEETIKKTLAGHYYRFQTSEDIVEFFSSLGALKKQKISLNELFLQGYKCEESITNGISSVIKEIKKYTPLNSHGYDFLVSNENINPKGSPLKRWMMYLRWMVRHDQLDMGLWSGVDKSKLILPLDTHTFNVSKKIGLLKKGSYNLDSAVKITEKLRKFDAQDPIKYDFAIYRLGQERLA
jgi:uncharacterized protein (TIGR02757 family)